MRALRTQGNNIQCLIFNIGSIRSYNFEEGNLTVEDAYSTLDKILNRLPSIYFKKPSEMGLNEYMSEIEKSVKAYVQNKKEDLIKRIGCIIDTGLNERYLIYLSQFSDILDHFTKRDQAFRQKWGIPQIPLVTEVICDDEVFDYFYKKDCHYYSIDVHKFPEMVNDFLTIVEQKDFYINQDSILGYLEQLDYVVKIQDWVIYNSENFNPYTTFLN